MAKPQKRGGEKRRDRGWRVQMVGVGGGESVVVVVVVVGSRMFVGGRGLGGDVALRVEVGLRVEVDRIRAGATIEIMSD